MSENPKRKKLNNFYDSCDWQLSTDRDICKVAEDLCKSFSVKACMGDVVSVDLIDSGSFSKIHKVYFSNKGYIVLKIMDNTGREEYEKERSVAEALSMKSLTCRYYGGVFSVATHFNASLQDDNSVGDIGVIAMEFLPYPLSHCVKKDMKGAIRSVFCLIDSLADLGLMNYDLKPSSFRADRKGILRMIDFTSSWISTKVKACTCLDGIVYPEKCRCIPGTVSKQYCKGVMKVLFTLITFQLFLYTDKENEDKQLWGRVVCDLIRYNLPEDERIASGLIGDVFKYDEDVKIIVVHYLKLGRIMEPGRESALVESSLTHDVWVSLSNIISERGKMSDYEILEELRKACYF